jgi:uncharacterized protein (TIGR03067 family)
MKKVLLGLAVIGLTIAADDKKDDLKDKLKGTWHVVAMEVNGKKVPEEFFKGQTMAFGPDKVTLKEKDKVESATYAVDAGQKPAHLDMTPTEGPDKGKTVKMIFQLDGDTLKIGMNTKVGERPKNFDDKEAGVLTLKREKK